jgi:hypothetical protein
MRRFWMLGVLAATMLAAGAAAAETDLATLLRRVAGNARFAPPVRVQVRFETPRPDGTRTSELVLYGRGRTVRVEAPDGLRALVKPGKAVVMTPGAPIQTVREKVVGGSAFLLEDLAPFTPESLRVPLISDEAPGKVVVTGEPRAPSPYALLVHTIDPDRAVIAASKFYRWEVSNLTKMTSVSEWVEVAGHWRPRVLELRDLGPGGDTTTITFAWQEAPALAASLFTPDGLRADPAR